MAAIAIPAPGTEYGPCVEDCTHVDCRASRQMAEEQCGICGFATGYEVRFFNDEQFGQVHVTCLMKYRETGELPLRPWEHAR